jgi:hypothetical protein
MGKKKRGQRTDLRLRPKVPPLEAALRKIQQAEDRLPGLLATDLNHSTSTQDFARAVADFGMLIREAEKMLHKVPAFVAWWDEKRPQSQRLVLNDWDRRVVGLVIDACDKENHQYGPEMQINRRSVTHRHEFVTESGPEPVYRACLRAFGLLKEGHGVAAGLPVN